MVRPADAQRHEAAAAGAQVVLQVDSQAGGRRHALGPVRPRDRHGHGRERSRTGPPTSTPSASRPRRWPRTSARRSSACRSPAPSATTTRSRNGPTTSITAWPVCSPGSAPRAGAARAVGRRAPDALRRAIPASWSSRAPASPSRPRRSTASRSTSKPRRSPRRLADWLTAPENPYFTRSIANRVWANFFGVGLVEKVDDMRVTNPASNEALLSAAAAFVVDNKFDLKALMKAILRSISKKSVFNNKPGREGPRRPTG